MALAERLQRLEKVADAKGCSFGRFLASLDPQTREVVDKLLVTNVANDVLRYELAAEGHKFARDTIRTHRQAKCLCATEGVVR